MNKYKNYKGLSKTKSKITISLLLVEILVISLFFQIGIKNPIINQRESTKGNNLLEKDDPLLSVGPVSKDTTGNALDIFVSGNYAYIADYSSDLAIIDISDPWNPGTRVYRSLSDWSYGVYVRDNYAYVACGTAGLAIINITDPLNPGTPVYEDTSGSASDLFVSGNFAYVADSDYGLAIINISDPTDPGTPVYEDTSGSARDVYVSGNYAYIADWNSGLAVINVTDPLNPGTPVYEATDDNAQSVYVSGNYAYVAADDAGLAIINISNPTDPGTPVYVPTLAQCWGIYVSGNYVYAACYTAGLAIINITDPINPSTPLYQNTNGYGYNVFVRGDYAYLADGPSGLTVIDILNPDNPLACIYKDTLGGIREVFVSGNYAYLAADDVSGLAVMDITDPMNPGDPVYETVTGDATGVWVEGNYAYLSNQFFGMIVYNISDPMNPEIIGSKDTSGQAHAVYVRGNYSYVADYDYGLAIINISDPTNPGDPIYEDTSGSAMALWVDGNYAYIADSSSGLAIINITDPQNPGTPIYEDTNGLAYDIAVSGNYAYVASGTGGLAVIDISNPLDPGTPSYLSLYGDVRSVYISGNYLYITTGPRLAMIDISNPLNLGTPVYEELIYTGSDVFVSGDYIYVAQGTAGMAVFNRTIFHTAPPIPKLISPSNDSLTYDSTPIIDWGAAFTASQYQLQIDDSSSLNSPTINIETDDTYYILNTPLSDGIYYWRVRAYNTNGWSSWSSVRSFTVDTPSPVYEDTSGNAQGVFVKGNYSYIADYTYGMAVINISNPLDPGTPIYEDTSGSANDVFISGNYAYIADWASGLAIINISDPMNPSTPIYVDTSGSANDVFLSGNYAYIADGTSGLAIINVTDPMNPGTPVYEDITTTTFGVYVSGNYSYVASGTSGLAIINVTDPMNPGTPIYVETDGDAWDVYVIGNYAYVADTDTGLAIINVTDPMNPGTPIYEGTTGSAKDVFLSGNYAYVSTGFTGIAVIDISDPMNPGTPIYIDTDEFAEDVYVSGNYAYVADRFSGLAVIDISAFLNVPRTPNPIAPTHEIFTNDNTTYIEWNSVYTASRYQLQIYNSSDLITPEVNITTVDIYYTLGTPLAEGLYHWRIRAQNANGWGGWTSNLTFTIDCTPPTWVQDPVNQIIKSGSSFQYNVNASDAYGISYYWISDTVNFQIDEDGNIINKRELNENIYTLEIRAYDRANNYISITISITVESSDDDDDDKDDVPQDISLILMILAAIGSTIVLGGGVYKKRKSRIGGRIKETVEDVKDKIKDTVADKVKDVKEQVEQKIKAVAPKEKSFNSLIKKTKKLSEEALNAKEKANFEKAQKKWAESLNLITQARSMAMDLKPELVTGIDKVIKTLNENIQNLGIEKEYSGALKRIEIANGQMQRKNFDGAIKDLKRAKIRLVKSVDIAAQLKVEPFVKILNKVQSNVEEAINNYNLGKLNLLAPIAIVPIGTGDAKQEYKSVEDIEPLVISEIEAKTPTQPGLMLKAKPKKDHKAEAPPLELTKEEKKELQKTEEEVSVKREEFICVVHKGTIRGDDIYLCPYCHTLYCTKCAKALKERSESCWTCGKEITVTSMIRMESKTQQKIQDLEEKLDVLKNTIKMLDDNFYTGAIDEAEYDAMKSPAMKKIAGIMTKIKKLKEKSTLKQKYTHLEVSRGGDWKNEGNQSVFYYKVKIKNKSEYLITNVQILLTSIPAGLEVKSDRYKIENLKPDTYESPTFKLIAKESCVGNILEGIVTYSDPKGKTNSIQIRPFEIKYVCNLLVPKQISKEEFTKKTSNMEIKVLSIESNVPLSDLEEKIKPIVTDCNFALMPREGIQSDEIRIIEGFAEGLYDKEEVAFSIELTKESKDATKVNIKAMSTKIDKLTDIIRDFSFKLDEIKSDTQIIKDYTSQIEDVFDKAEDIENLLKDSLGSDFTKIKYIWQDFKDGKIGRKEFITQSLKKIGKKFAKSIIRKFI